MKTYQEYLKTLDNITLSQELDAIARIISHFSTMRTHLMGELMARELYDEPKIKEPSDIELFELSETT